MAYLELPLTQHAFDVLASIRCRHTTMGAVRFLEGMRAPGRAADPTSRARPVPGLSGQLRPHACGAGHAGEFLT